MDSKKAMSDHSRDLVGYQNYPQKHKCGFSILKLFREKLKNISLDTKLRVTKNGDCS